MCSQRLWLRAFTRGRVGAVATVDLCCEGDHDAVRPVLDALSERWAVFKHAEDEAGAHGWYTVEIIGGRPRTPPSRRWQLSCGRSIPSAPSSRTAISTGARPSERVAGARTRWGDRSVSSDLLDIFLLALVAMFNPSLLAAVTVMLLLPNPKRLMLGYLLGAYLISITLGLVIVFTLHGSSAESTSKHTVSPVEDIVVGLLALAIAWILRTGRDRPLEERRHKKQQAKLEAKREAGKPTESLPLRLLGKGDPRITFVVGIILSFPGVSYLDALDHIHHLNPGTVATVLLVVGFCLFQQILLELPLLGYVFAPDRTQDTVTRFKNWIARKGRTAVVIGAGVIGVILIARGIINLL